MSGEVAWESNGVILHADQILVIDGGKVIEQGKHSDLIARDGLYRRFWKKRQKARGWKLVCDHRLA